MHYIIYTKHGLSKINWFVMLRNQIMLSISNEKKRGLLTLNWLQEWCHRAPHRSWHQLQMTRRREEEGWPPGLRQPQWCLPEAPPCRLIDHTYANRARKIMPKMDFLQELLLLTKNCVQLRIQPHAEVDWRPSLQGSSASQCRLRDSWKQMQQPFCYKNCRQFFWK